MQKIIVSFLLLVLIFGALGIFLWQKDIIFSNNSSAIGNHFANKERTLASEDTPENFQDDLGKISTIDRIEEMKKRLALKGLIIDGDRYFRNYQLSLALKNYLDFYRQHPNDNLILLKIGNTYLEMKKFSKAYEYFSKISKPDNELAHKIARIIIAQTDFSNPNDIQLSQQKIRLLPFSSPELFYYLTLLDCPINFHECKLKMHEYFWPDSGGVVVVPYSRLAEIKKSIENYRNFGIDEVYLKNAFIIGAIYEHELYNLSLELSQQLLKAKPNYKPILKIAGQSAYEMGSYELARSYFKHHFELDDSDPGVSYMLGIINMKLKEYVLANIYFDRSIMLGYGSRANVRRQAIYNFHQIGNTEKLLQSFSTLINEGEFESEDLAIAIYYHILYEQLATARTWAKLGQEKYSANANFYAYEGWILRERSKFEEAKVVLETGYKLDSKNPFVLLNLALVEKDMKNFGSMKVFLTKVEQIAPDSEFAAQAKKELEDYQKSIIIDEESEHESN